MIRYVGTGIVSAVVGAGIVILLFFVANPIPSSLVCSISPERKVVDCTDEKGKQMNIPHDVQIR